MARKIKLSESTLSLFSEIAEAVLELTGAHVACVLIAEEDDLVAKAVEVAAGAPLGEPADWVSTSVVERVLERRQPVIARDAGGDELLRNRESIRELQIRTVMCVPLLDGDNVLGALYASSFGVEAAFDEERLAEFLAFASEVTHFLRQRAAEA